MKHLQSRKALLPMIVTPFVGVWIETPNNPLSKLDTEVTPFVGVWIETMILSLMVYI